MQKKYINNKFQDQQCEKIASSQCKRTESDQIGVFYSGQKAHECSPTTHTLWVNEIYIVELLWCWLLRHSRITKFGEIFSIIMAQFCNSASLGIRNEF